MMHESDRASSSAATVVSMDQSETEPAPPKFPDFSAPVSSDDIPDFVDIDVDKSPSQQMSTGKLKPSKHKLKKAELRIFAQQLPIKLQMHLVPEISGRPNPNVSFRSELTYRHIIPALVEHGLQFLSPTEQEILHANAPLFAQYNRVKSRYQNIDPSSVRGFASYYNSESETSINEHRAKLMSAALFHLDFSIQTMVNWMGGPHTAQHRDEDKMLANMMHMNCVIRDEWFHRVKHGAPKHCHAYSSDKNFRDFWNYGNHNTVDESPEVFEEVTVKDFKRGNTILVDPELAPFIPHMHVTPQGIVDIDNPYKPPRPIFDSTFRPCPSSMAINDWIDPKYEGIITFIHSIQRIATAIWNLRISYPNQPLYIGDDDVSNAFRLVKLHPSVVGMHGFRAGNKKKKKYLGFCTGMTFGDNCSPANFEAFAIGMFFVSTLAINITIHETH